MRGQKMSVFVHAQGKYKNCPRRGGGVKKWQNSVHVVVESIIFVLVAMDGFSNYYQNEHIGRFH